MNTCYRTYEVYRSFPHLRYTQLFKPNDQTPSSMYLGYYPQANCNSGGKESPRCRVRRTFVPSEEVLGADAGKTVGQPSGYILHGAREAARQATRRWLRSHLCFTQGPGTHTRPPQRKADGSCRKLLRAPAHDEGEWLLTASQILRNLGPGTRGFRRRFLSWRPRATGRSGQ